MGRLVITMSAFHCLMSRVTARRFSSVGSSSPSWLSSTSLTTPNRRATSATSFLRRRASGPPADSQWPMSPLVVATSFTWWPCFAHFMATPAARYSGSSGWAPKTMMRSLPSAGAWGAAAWARTVRGCLSCSVPSRNPNAAGGEQGERGNFHSHFHMAFSWMKYGTANTKRHKHLRSLTVAALLGAACFIRGGGGPWMETATPGIRPII